ncbi:head GIN domain-containing protein [Joostella sp.]|uniref:head GIN domain-containing protein n=1 Tax=Joostella sp. TaxID=2231138 RepID=UPI003A9273CC
MSTLIKVFITLLIAIFFTSCNFNFQNGVTGNGNVINQQREINQSFDAIKATEGINVFVAQGAEISIKVEADENIIDLIRTEVNNGALVIDTKEQIGRVSAKKVYVTLPEISELKSTSGGSITSIGTINSATISLDASSGSDIYVELQSKEVTVNTSSGAEIELYGVTNILKAHASSGSDIKTEKLKAHLVEAHASSGADIDVNASDEIAIHKSSGGDVDYIGSPKRVEKVSID